MDKEPIRNRRSSLDFHMSILGGGADEFNDARTKEHRDLKLSVVMGNSAVALDSPLMAKCGDSFKKFDENDDGAIDRKELLAALEEIGLNPNDQEITQLMMEMDLDKNGTLDFIEYCQFVAKSKSRGYILYKNEEKVLNLSNAWRSLLKTEEGSKEGDIPIDRLANLLDTFGLSGGIGKRLAGVADTNKDNRISFEEFKELMQTPPHQKVAKKSFKWDMEH